MVSEQPDSIGSSGRQHESVEDPDLGVDLPDQWKPAEANVRRWSGRAALNRFRRSNCVRHAAERRPDLESAGGCAPELRAGGPSETHERCCFQVLAVDISRWPISGVHRFPWRTPGDLAQGPPDRTGTNTHTKSGVGNRPSDYR